MMGTDNPAFNNPDGEQPDETRQQVGTVLMPVISDDQAIGVFVTALNTSEVAVYFPSPVSGMVLTSAEARSMGKSLLEKADAAEEFAAQHGNPIKTTRKRHKKAEKAPNADQASLAP